MPPVNQNPASQQSAYPSPHTGRVPGFDPNVPIAKTKKHRSRLLIPFVLVSLILLIAIGLGFWAFMSRQDYKNNSDKKSAQAVSEAEAALDKRKEADFVEREKEPLKTYNGPATFGSLEIKYPKTWAAYINEAEKGSTPIDGYLHPDFVPGLTSGTAFALHFEVVSQSYSVEIGRFEASAKSGKVTISPTTVPNVSSVAGVRVEGEIETGKQGTVVLFPVRDKTLKITSESNTFKSDFDNIILKNLVFVP